MRWVHWCAGEVGCGVREVAAATNELGYVVREVAAATNELPTSIDRLATIANGLPTTVDGLPCSPCGDGERGGVGGVGAGDEDPDVDEAAPCPQHLQPTCSRR